LDGSGTGGDFHAGLHDFANGIIGAVMVGWMTGIITLARGPFAAGQEWAWKAIALPLAVWFGVDCAFTIAHQAWGNLVLNLGTALMFGIPLAAAKKHCNRPGWRGSANSPAPTGRGTRSSCRAEASPLCAFLRSAQAAQARHQRSRNSPLLPGRSESVVREFLRSYTSNRTAGSACWSASR
jgi:hypothetical protein